MTAAQAIRFGGLRRNFVWLLLACLATFVGVIVVFKGDAPAAPAAALAQPLEQEVQTALPPASQAPGTAPTSTSSAVPQPYSAPGTGGFPAGASAAGDADERATAIRELDAAAPDAFAVLEQTVHNDPIARNRLLAVNSLRLMAKSGRNVDQVRPVLQVAMADSDANVAASARDADQELAR